MGRPRKRPNAAGHWQCTKCKVWKPKQAYYKNYSTSNGLNTQCIECMTAQRNERKRLSWIAEIAEDTQSLYPKLNDASVQEYAELQYRLTYELNEHDPGYIELQGKVQMMNTGWYYKYAASATSSGEAEDDFKAGRWGPPSES